MWVGRIVLCVLCVVCALRWCEVDGVVVGVCLFYTSSWHSSAAPLSTQYLGSCLIGSVTDNT